MPSALSQVTVGDGKPRATQGRVTFSPMLAATSTGASEKSGAAVEATGGEGQPPCVCRTSCLRQRLTEVCPYIQPAGSPDQRWFQLSCWPHSGTDRRPPPARPGSEESPAGGPGERKERSPPPAPLETRGRQTWWFTHTHSHRLTHSLNHELTFVPVDERGGGA